MPEAPQLPIKWKPEADGDNVRLTQGILYPAALINGVVKAT